MAGSDDKWTHVSKMLCRAGPLANQGNFGTLIEPAVPFEPTPENLEFLQQECRILVVGAGGLGCELLKDLALQGFGNIDVIDTDTIDISSQNHRTFRGSPRVQRTSYYILILNAVKVTTVHLPSTCVQTPPMAPAGPHGPPLVPDGRWLHPVDARAEPEASSKRLWFPSMR